MLKLDEKLAEVVAMNFPLLIGAMRLNGTIFQKGFRSELESFKTGLVARMKYDFVRMIEDTSKTRPQKGNLKKLTSWISFKPNKKSSHGLQERFRNGSSEHRMPGLALKI